MPQDFGADLPAIVVAPGVGWLRLPSGTTIQLAGRPACKKVVAALLERRMAAPGAPIPRADLMSLACTGAAWNRAKVFRGIMKRLRAAGLDEIVIRLADGYLLNPTIPVARAVRSAEDEPRVA